MAREPDRDERLGRIRDFEIAGVLRRAQGRNRSVDNV
jgi:hypothetical protein